MVAIDPLTKVKNLAFSFVNSREGSRNERPLGLCPGYKLFVSRKLTRRALYDLSVFYMDVVLYQSA